MMTGIGIALGLDGRSGQPLASLRTMLDRVAEIGFTHAELSAKSLAVACGGTLLPRRLEALRVALDGVTLRFTVHGTNISSARAGNLMDVSSPNQRRVAETDLALAAAIGAEVVVIHSGSLRDVYGDDDAVARGMTAECEALRALGDVAGRHGIRIAVENIDPVGAYIARRAYGLRLDTLGEQIARVDHPQVGICFDAGHAYLASVYAGFDYLDAIRGIAAQIVHVHLSDNLGRVELDGDVDQSESLALGDGDLHLIPGWGTVPLSDVFRIPFPHCPIVVLEMRPHFAEHVTEALATMRELVAIQDASLEPVGAVLPEPAALRGDAGL
jgi:sugar phosphate isomerase/epimerase